MATYSNVERRLLKSFGENLRRARKDAGLSQERLAEQCSLHRTYIGSAERGERNVSILNLHKIANALGRDANELV